MTTLYAKLKVIVAATFAIFLAVNVNAQDARLDPLFERLLKVDAADAPLIEQKIVTEWSKSGSASMDFLVRRAAKALEAEEWETALDHLTALTDHAPEFAEGWHLKAVAHFNREELGFALDAIERALAAEPRHFHAMGGLMAILEQSGQDDKALEVAMMIRAIHPHFEDLTTIIDRLSAKTEGQPI